MDKRIEQALEVIEQGLHYAYCLKRGMEPCSCVEDAANDLAFEIRKRIGGGEAV